MEQFAAKHVSDKEEFLVNVHEAEAYVHQKLRQNEDGIYSDEVKGTAKDNLYVGNAGILHMYVQLNLIKPSKEYENIIKEMTRYLNIHLFDGVKLAKTEGEFVPGMAEAFYSGIGGIGLVFNEVYRTSENEYTKECAKEGSFKIIDYYMKHANETKEGCFWSDNAAIFFDGGIILFLIDCLKTYEKCDGILYGKVSGKQDVQPSKAYSEELMRLITKSCDYILKNGIWHDDGGLEIDHLKVDFKRREPNFEFGTAGIGYLFAKAYEVTGDKKYLDGAKATAIYIKSIAVKQKKGYLIPYKLGKYDDLFYLGNCHGPVGTAKLFYELYLITGERSYLNEAVELCEGAISLGAPFKQSAGFWNTTCVCCGPAGYVPFLAGLYYETGDEIYRKLAHETGEVLVGTKTKQNINSKEVSFWNIAFDRTKPYVLSAPAGYFTGAAGIAVALLQVYCMEKGDIHTEGLIDDPYRK